MSNDSPIQGTNQNIPFTGSSTEDNALGLSNPDSILGGTLRSTQNVGTDGAALDAANNRILLQNPVDGSSVGFGTIPGSATKEFGFFSLDNSGNVIMKIVNGNLYMLDPSAGNIVRLELGKLPDNTYNLATSKPGQDLTTAFS